MRTLVAILSLLTAATPTIAGEVAIYTGLTQWIDKAPADAQAAICSDKLTALSITNTIFDTEEQAVDLAEWVTNATDNGEVDVLVLYGDIPPTIYEGGNLQTDGSLAELFIESEDGDAIINHADYMFWGFAARNGEGGLQNMTDIPGIVMWDDNTPMVVTAEGSQIAPSLTDFPSDRPFHLDQLAGEWAVEVSLAQNEAGTRADPVIVRDGPRGRLIPVQQTAFGGEPQGAVAAEIIAWLFGKPLGAASKLALTGGGATLVGRPLKIQVQIQEATGSPSPALVATTVNLVSNSATGRFDLTAGGPFDGTVTSLVIPAGEHTAEFFYRDSAAGAPTVSASAGVLTGAALQVKFFTQSRAPAGEVTIYTGTTQWIAKNLADEQAAICIARLGIAGVDPNYFQLEADGDAVAEWVTNSTGNGRLDVLVLYGDPPPTIYAGGNTQPDGSPAELFIESTDGDAIINHADYMFWGLAARNGEGGLQNMMDIPGIVMWDDNTPMTVTSEGASIAPSLSAFLTDRPFHLDQLINDWHAEVILAQNEAGTRADPAIVRDGDRGRLINVYQTADQADPKGAVAAEIIAYLLGLDLGGPTQLALTGGRASVVGTPTLITVHLQDVSSTPRPSTGPVTVNLASSSATGDFDIARNGAFDGSVTSFVIPAGQLSGSFYFRDTAAGAVSVTASSAGMTDGQIDVEVRQDVLATKGEVMIYTGQTQWITKELADAQAQISFDLLSAGGVTTSWINLDTEMQGVADWVADMTDNGKLDVLVLYGDIPPTIYEGGNLQPDGSLAELFIESTDGDMIMNHADYMFWGFEARNGVGGLENMTDIPGIVMWDDNTPMKVTLDGAAITPSLGDFLTDRPFHLDQLQGEWYAELILAQNEAGTRADPVIVRDGIRGRLAPAFQTADQADPKGAVAAEIILWLLGQISTVPEICNNTIDDDGDLLADCNDPDCLSSPLCPSAPVFHRGDSNDDGRHNISDPVNTLNVLFLGTGTIPCQDAADSNDDGKVNISDPVNSLNVLFLGTGAVPPPLPPEALQPCGPDPTSDDGGDLGCASYTNC